MNKKGLMKFYAIQRFDPTSGEWKQIGIHQKSLKEAESERARLKRMVRKGWDDNLVRIVHEVRR